MRFWRCSLVILLFFSCKTGEKPPSVDGNKAFAHLEKILALGPRPAGSEALQHLRTYLRCELETYGYQIEEDRFTAQTPKGERSMVNLIAKLPGSSPQSLLLASHMDSKEMAEFIFLGANDSGSSTALLLEIARVLVQQPRLKATIRLAFFDGEEALQQWSADDSLYGSRHLAKRWQEEGILPDIKAMILLDMIGDRDLSITLEKNSSKWLVEIFRDAAHELNKGKYFFQTFSYLEDDHMPFMQRDVAAINIIDFHYGKPTEWGAGSYWHTAEDTLDKISAESLQIVGEVTLLALRKIDQLMVK